MLLGVVLGGGCGAPEPVPTLPPHEAEMVKAVDLLEHGDAAGAQPVRHRPVARRIAAIDREPASLQQHRKPGHAHPADADKMHMALWAGQEPTHGIDIFVHEKNE